FSGTETALTTISKVKVKLLKEQKRRGINTLEKILNQPHKMLATTLVGNNLVNILASVFATLIMLQVLRSANWLEHVALGTGVVTGVMTFLILTFGEITPKTIALAHREEFALFAAPIIYLLNWFLAPIVLILIYFPEFIMRLLKITKSPYSQYVTEKEVKALIDTGKEDGVIAEEEKKMMHKVLEFNDTLISSVMTPRSKIVAIEVSSSLDEVMKVFSKNPLSRLPVYNKKLDNIVGALYAKDVLLWLSGSNTRKAQFANLGSALRKPIFVLETRKTDSVFRQMKREKNHFAIVVNSKGALVGIITLEDLVEEIVGEIEDEFDEARPSEN
ncbi:MAG: hemolysin family protein, partial [Candidatus Margulisbacteria bacterium]|nr:hemolysin family protein [Candidatus Margulisiibacteriota bacterium]